jgi:hypothetical protein
MKTNRLLTVVIALQVVMLAGQWLQGPTMLATAKADLPNPAADRQETIDLQKETNSKLDQIVTVLQGGNLQVKVVQSDDQKDAGHNR